MHLTADVCDLAVTLTSVLRDAVGRRGHRLWVLAAAVAQGYQRVRPLEPAEVDVLGELVPARLALSR